MHIPKYDEDFEELMKKVKSGDAQAQNDLGYMFLFARDFGNAEKFFRLAAEQGNAKAQFNLGMMYHNGTSLLRQSDEEAKKWWTLAAEQGNEDAQFGLATNYPEIYYKVEKNDTLKAAEQGNAIAECNLGSMYYDGRGVEQSYEKAAYWYEKAAEQEIAIAQFNLGVMYYKGRGVEQSYEKAAYWFEKAAEQGDADAIKALQKMQKK